MRAFILLAILGIVGTGPVEAENFRFNPIPLKDYQASSKADNARIRVSVALDDQAITKPLKIGGIVVCSSTACYRPNTVVTNDPANSGIGTAKLVVDSIMPATQIDSIYFEDLKGGDIAGSITLANPLKIESGYYGGEIFVTVAQSNSRGTSPYIPIYAASNLLRESGKSIYYNPKFAAKVDLGTGVSLSMPAYALKHPSILSAQVSDIGAPYPIVDIYPYVELAKPATLTAMALQTNKTLALAAVRVTSANSSMQKSASTKSQIDKTVSAFSTFNPSFLMGPKLQPQTIRSATID